MIAAHAPCVRCAATMVEAPRPSTCARVAVIPARPGVAIAPFVRRLAATLDRAVATVHAVATRAELHALREVDHVLIVADATHPPEQHALERDLLSGEPFGRRAPRTLVLLHPPETALPRGTARWLQARDVDQHRHVRVDRDGDVDRVARALTGRSVGLVLGAGGARGLAHVGTIRALAEQRIPIDHVGGTSIGALVGAMHAMGRSPDEMMDFARRMAATRPFLEFGLPITSLLRGRRMERIVKEAFGDTTIEDLWIPFFCTSCDISRFREVVHDRGALGPATLASSALPGVLPPQVRDGCLLVDGGTTDMLPGELMRARNTGPMIAVDVSAERELSPIEHYPTSWSALWHRLRPGTPRTPSLTEVFWRAVAFGVARRTAAVAEDADIFLRPPVERFGTTELGAMDEIARRGYEHARDRLRGTTRAGIAVPIGARREAARPGAGAAPAL